MSQTQYRANLSAKDFVYLSEQWGRTVILKQYDQNFSRQVVSAADPDKDIGIPQIYYCHNVMPIGQGFGSIGYKGLLLPTADVPNFKYVRYVNDLTNNGYCYLAFNVVSSTIVNVYKFNPAVDSTWVFVQGLVTSLDAGVPFTATINGQTYIYIPFQGCYTFDIVTNLLTPVTLTGLNPGGILGITEAFGYMIAWGTNAVFWSSTVTPTDFTPSLVTGAGGGQVQQILGNIALCIPNIYGFMIYSDKNAVSAVYSGNPRYPFNFRPVVSSGGVVDSGLVTVDPESGNLYSYGTAGLQLLSVTQATNPFPELTNFLDGSRFEDFNDTTLQFTQSVISPGTLRKKITAVAQRYVVISFGLAGSNIFTHALVWDASMKRWGKLKADHTEVFEYISTFQFADQQARQSIALMGARGDVNLVLLQQDSNSAPNSLPNQGTIILGKYQHTRTRWMTMDGVDIETIGVGGITVNLIPTYDGKTWQAPTKLSSISPQITKTFPARVSGMNITLVVQGDFQMDSLVLSYHPSGRR